MQQIVNQHMAEPGQNINHFAITNWEPTHCLTTSSIQHIKALTSQAVASQTQTNKLAWIVYHTAND